MNKETMTFEEIRLSNTLKGKSRMDTDEIIADYEKRKLEKELEKND